MGENKSLLQLREPRPSTSFQPDERIPDPKIYSEPLSKLFPEKPIPTRLVLPSAGFCVKILGKQHTKKKIFINVCHADGIPPPRDITAEELAEVWCSKKYGNFRVPMSIAAPHEERDRQEAPCDVYDVAINSKFYDKTEKDSLFRRFLIEVAVDGVATKFNVDINDANGLTVLKKRKAMGNIQTHCIQVRNASFYRKIIEEVPMSGVPEGSDVPQGSIVPVTGIPQGSSCGSDSSQYALMLVPSELGKNLVGRFYIPNYGDTDYNANDLKLELGMDRIRIHVVSLNFLVDIFIPVFIDTDHAVSTFDLETDVLTITAPVLNYEYRASKNVCRPSMMVAK